MIINFFRRPTPWRLIVLCLSQAMGEQSRGYRLLTELEHNLMRGTKRNESNPEVMGSRGTTLRWVG